MNQQRVRQPVGRRITTEGRKTLALCLSAAALLGGLALFHTWTRVAIIQRGYELARLKAQHEKFQREITKFSIEGESRSNAATVDREAHARLGMEKASKILVLKATETAQRAVITGEALAQNGF